MTFLDGDDELEPDTLEGAISLFERHFDDIDLVVYPMKTIDGGKIRQHFRDAFYPHTGVYDLSNPNRAIAPITNMNVIVKKSANTPFFEEDLTVHEDQEFLSRIILEKQRIGYSKQGAFLYKRRSDNATKTVMHPFYQFEKDIALWEKLFDEYPKEVPVYLQSIFLYDIAWKLKCDALFPYHYGKAEYEEAEYRLFSLLGKVSLEVFLASKNTDIYHKVFLLSRIDSASLACGFNPSGVEIVSNGSVVCFEDSVELYFFKSRADSNEWTFRGFIKTPISSVTPDPPELEVVSWEDEKEVRHSCPLFHSSWGHHRSRVETNTFWDFCFSAPMGIDAEFKFECRYKGVRLPVKLFFCDKRGLCSAAKRWKMRFGRSVCSVDGRGGVSNPLDQQAAAEKGGASGASKNIPFKQKGFFYPFYDRAHAKQ